MKYNFDFTRNDGTEVMVSFRISGGGGDFIAGGCWNPGDPLEIEFEPKVYGLPEGETLTEAEWTKIEQAILADPPEYEPFEDDVF